MTKLVFIISDGEDLDFPLTAETTTLGRRESNDIVIDNSWISGQHAAFARLADGQYELRDLESSNGTFVNGAKITTIKLKDGDKVSFGQLEAVFIHATEPKQLAAKTIPLAVPRVPPTPSKPSATVNSTPSSESAAKKSAPIITSKPTIVPARAHGIPTAAETAAPRGVTTATALVTGPAAALPADAQRAATLAASAKAELDAATQALADLNRQIAATVTAENARKMQTAQELQKAQTALQGLQSEAARHEAMQREVATMQATLLGLRNEVASLQSVHTTLTQTNSNLPTKLQVEQARQVNAATLASTTEGQNERLSAAQLELEETEKTLAETLRRNESEQRRSRELATKASEELRGLKSQIEQAQSTKEELAAAKAELTAVRSELRMETEQRSQAQAKALAQISELEAQVLTLQQLDQTLRDHKSPELLALEADLHRQSAALRLVQSQFTEKQAELAAQTAEHERSVSAHATLTAQLAHAQQALAGIEAKLEERMEQLGLSDQKLQQLAETTATMAELESTLHSMRLSCRQEKATLATLTDERSSMLHELDALSKKADTLKTQEALLAKVEQDLHTKCEEQRQLEIQVDHHKAQVTEFQAALHAGKLEKSSEDKRYTQLQNQLIEIERRLALAQRKTIEAETSLLIKNQAMDQASASLDGYQRELQRNVQNGDIKLQTQRGELDKLGRQRDDLQREFARSEQELKARAAALEKAQRELSAVRATSNELQASLTAQQNEQHNGKVALEALRQERRKGQHDLNNFLQRHIMAESDLKSVEEKLSQAKKSLDQRERECLEQEIRLQQIQASQQHLNHELDASRKAQQTFEERKAQLRQEITAMEAHYQECQAKGSAASAHQHQAENQIRALQEAIHQAESNLAALQAARVAMAQEIKEVETHRHRAGNELQVLLAQQQTLQHLTPQVEQQQLNLSNLLTQIAQLESKRIAAATQITRLQRQLDDLEERKRCLDGAIDLNWGTVHAMSKGLIKHLDLLDEMILHADPKTTAPETLTHLKVFRAGILDLLAEYSITAYTYPPDTVVDMAARKRIQIVETTTGKSEFTKISKTFRPGYICDNGTVETQTLLRKAEVAIETPN